MITSYTVSCSFSQQPYFLAAFSPGFPSGSREPGEQHENRPVVSGMQLLSSALFFGVLGGGIYLFFKAQSAGSGGREAVEEVEDEGNDILENARKLMDKYK